MINPTEAGINQFIQKNKARYPSGFFLEEITLDESSTRKLVVLTRVQRIELAENVGDTILVESIQESAGERAVVGDAVTNLYTTPESTSLHLADQLLPGEKIRFFKVAEFPGWLAVSVEHDFPGQAPFEVGWMNEEKAQSLGRAIPRIPETGSEDIYNVVRDYEGTPYLLSGKTKHGIDCSGLTQQIIKRTKGVTLPRLARWQALVGTPIAREELQPGDLAFFSEGSERVNHVGVILEPISHGKPTIAHSSLKNCGVKIENLDEANWLSGESDIRLAGYRRIGS